VALLLVAELLRNTGKYTMGDVLAFRMRQRPVRAAAATSTLVVSFFYLLAQMAGAGGLIALLLKIPPTNQFGQGVVIAVVGILMIIYVLVGGMKGTTYVQIIKAVLLLVAAAVMTVWVLGSFGFNFNALLGDAAAKSPQGLKVLAPGLQYKNPIDLISLGLALVLGYGASALLPPGTINSANQNNAAPLLAFHLGGEVLLGIVAAIAFATILAVVAGLTITASASFAHDVYANVIKRGQASPDSEVRIARITAVVIGVIAIAGGILANGQNIAFLVALAFAVAASANLPTILYSLFWKKFNTTGAPLSIYGGLSICIILIVFSPAVSGKPIPAGGVKSPSMLQGVDFHWFPLDNPGLVSIPLSFLLGIIGTYVGARKEVDQAKFAEMEVRSLTGAGSEKATSH
jgi:cation/acetate symporter